MNGRPPGPPNPAAAAATPSPAATLILVRPGATAPEILLLKRSPDARFMPNAYVFAGGAVDSADGSSEVYALCAGMDDLRASDILTVPANGLRFFAAAIREAFEECGLLLAYDESGSIVDLSGWGEERMRPLREQVCGGQTGLAALCRLHGWRLAVDELVYFDHWITPPSLKRRFDTRFFIARAPARQIASLAGEEMSDLVWRSAAAALASHRKGELLLMQATRSILGEIARFDRLDALFAFARSGRKIVPTTPESGTEPLSGARPAG